MSVGSYRRTRFLPRELWLFWIFALPFLVVAANLGVAHGNAGYLYVQGFWAVADGLLTGLAAIFFLRESLIHRLVFALFYAGSYFVPLMVFTWAIMAWLAPDSDWPSLNIYLY